ncbi:rubrerythrin family protein [uncultured Clostridium sp.]|uniref:rubrerythrin family protein n=1 Tax=uncultured Clostridium sp. TaxID=59620 RepID=UPI0025D009B7|nr:ferritin family protein [uncultured Clostridium sp.]
MNLKGSRTEKNLYKTFAGECRARTKYDLYAEKAKCDGYMWIAEVFEETAKNEFAHAREAYKKYLSRINCTKNNLIEAAVGESEEANVIYKEFEKIAEEEGFHEIAHFYKELQEVEEHHKKRYLELAKKMKDNILYKSNNKDTLWMCLNCGYIHEGCEAPERCPLCGYSIGYFKNISSKICK